MGLKPELRDGNTIRAYLDELVLLKTPVQLWLPQSDALPFETTLARVARDTFTTAQTPPLPRDQGLNFSFMVDSRRFIATTQVVSTGVFRIPLSVTQGERRERLRAAFAPADGIQVFACERVVGTVLLGRTVTGRLLELSLQGLRVAIDEIDEVVCLAEGATDLKRGDTFAAVRVSGLPYTPTIQCGAIVAHVDPQAAGLLLTGLLDLDRRNIERILARRFPTTFGQAFPKKHRKTDIADQPGAPVLTHEPIKAPEVVAPPAAPAAPPAGRPARPEASPLVRVRKAARKILVISAGDADGRSLADDLREDDFRQVAQAKSYLEAQTLARTASFDLILLDVKVGGHWGQMILEALHRNGLLLEVPVILVADRRDASVAAVAEAVEAVHVHEKRAPYADLVPALYDLI